MSRRSNVTPAPDAGPLEEPEISEEEVEELEPWEPEDLEDYSQKAYIPVVSFTLPHMVEVTLALTAITGIETSWTGNEPREVSQMNLLTDAKTYRVDGAEAERVRNELLLLWREG